MAENEFDIVCSSHLTWDLHLFQRPQQIMTRLSKDHKVLYVIPISLQGLWRFKHMRKRSFRYLKINKNLTYYRPVVLPFGEQYPLIKRINEWLVINRIKNFMKRKRFSKNLLLWLYTPMAYYLPGQLGEKAVVYDCMDDFISFLHAPKAIAEKEKMITKAADVFFAGGDTLLQNKGAGHPNAAAFSCGVDAEHFAKAAHRPSPAPVDIAGIKGRILGYFGAVDERIDYDLLEFIANYDKSWQIVIVGPIVKIKRPDCFDRIENIHYLDFKLYKELPVYASFFDVCLIPFKMNDAVTQHLNPTKTLEYLAMGKPIVSTALPDIVKNFTGMVSIANSYEEFAGCVKDRLEGKDNDMCGKGLSLVKTKSWDAMVAGMLDIIRKGNYFSK
ncbi:MAG: glycosyltransferase [Candidatus Magnetominusculus sp. LBB02]|nr:glycosyltransferase [Candidatus Magnetominusculus sp. LBB02]